MKFRSNRVTVKLQLTATIFPSKYVTQVSTVFVLHSKCKFVCISVAHKAKIKP